MKRIIFPLLLSALTLLGGPAAAQRSTGPIQLAPDAPDTYTVVKGDTLWGISGRFLKQPWRWPEVWRINRSQIRNPHLIYPGQVVMLDRSGPYLSIGRPVGGGGGGGTQRLGPQVYSEPIEHAIPSIPMYLIEPFLTRPLVFDSVAETEDAVIVAVETGRVMTGQGDTVFATGVEDGNRNWSVVRKAQPLIDPVTKEVLGFEAQYLGGAQVVEYTEPAATLRLTEAVEEIRAGDRLVHHTPPKVFSYVPHGPSTTDLDGRVIGIYRGVTETGRHNVITLNLGADDGIDEGTVLALHQVRGTAIYKPDGAVRAEAYQLPDRRNGLAFVFRVFDRVSYALIMHSDGAVAIGDAVRAP